MHSRSYGIKQRRTRQFRIASNVLLGLLVAATAAVVYYALAE